MSATTHRFAGDLYADNLHGTLERAHVAAGTATYAVYNAAVTGLLAEEQHLNPLRGGFGDLTAGEAPGPGETYWDNFTGTKDPKTQLLTVDAVLPAVVGSVAAGKLNPLCAAVSSVANTIVLRDASGYITLSNITINKPTTTVTISILNPQVIADVSAYGRTVGSGGLLNVITITGEAAAGGSISVKVNATLNEKNVANTGTIEILQHAEFAFGAPGTWTIPAQNITDTRYLETNIAQCTITLTTVGDDLYVTLTGPTAAVDVDWTVHALVVYQRKLAV